MFTFLAWIFFSLIVGAIGSDRTIGFWGSFFLSLILSPVVGLIFAVLSKSKAAEAERKKSMQIQKETLDAIKEKPVHNVVEELEKLSNLRKSGAINESEFLLAKQKLLSN